MAQKNSSKPASVNIGFIFLVILSVSVGLYIYRGRVKNSNMVSSSRVSMVNYTNKTFGYSIKLLPSYEVPTQTEKQISQMGVDNNMSIKSKSDLNGSGLIIVDVSLDVDNLSLGDYMNKNLKMFGVTGPLVSYNFNGYDSLFNKNQPGTNLFVKQGQYVYHLTATDTSFNKEVRDMIDTFRFVK